MKGLDFPLYKIRIDDKTKYNLNTVEGRKEYFEAKTGKEIKKLKTFLRKNTFVAYMLGKKGAGKGTYSKLFSEIFGSEKAIHLSVGDIIRTVEQDLKDNTKKKDIVKFLKKNYRGYAKLEDQIAAFSTRSTKGLSFSSEFILTLIKRELTKYEKKSLFIDGFPRNTEQINYTLYFRELIDYREDPDLFVLIDIPEVVIEERIKSRRICPVCNLSKNLKLNPTKYVEFEPKTSSFYLKCDNLDCSTLNILIKKEGDELGISPIRERLELDEQVIKKVFDVNGVPKVLLRNSIPVNIAKELVNEYDITPEYSYELDKNGKVKIIEKEWKFFDDNGIESYSLLAAAVVVSMIRQFVEALGL